MTYDNIAQFATIMVEYERWRKEKASKDVDLSVSAYLDEYALRNQALLLATIIETVDEVPNDEELGLLIRSILGDN